MTQNNYRLREVTFLSQTVAFRSPAAWKVREATRDNEAEIHLLGPRNQANTYSTSAAIRLAPAQGQTAQAAANELLATYRAAFPCETKGPTPLTVAGVRAYRVEIAYVMPLPLNNVLAQPTPLRESVVLLRHGDLLIELRYAAAEEMYAAWLAVFETLLHSLSFSGKEASAAVALEMTDAFPLALRETRSSYHIEEDENDDASAERQ